MVHHELVTFRHQLDHRPFTGDRWLALLVRAVRIMTSMLGHGALRLCLGKSR
jgi:hypothetical protein